MGSARFVFLLAALSSCAELEILPFCPSSDETWGQRGEGYVIYEPHPYLKVTFDKDDVAIVTTEYLPNRKKAYRVRQYACFASITASLTYKDGWMLTNMETSMDTTEIAKAVIAAAEKAIATREPTAQDKKRPRLLYFPMEFDEKTGLLKGFGPPIAP